jgi:hypothetical protein
MGVSDLFVVRVWRPRAGGFRASVRRVDEEETRLFTEPADVAQFLDVCATDEAPGKSAPAAARTDEVNR